MTARGSSSHKTRKLVVTLLALGISISWRTEVSSKTNANALKLDLGPLGRLSYRDGLLRIQPPQVSSPPIDSFEVPWDQIKPRMISIEHKLVTPSKGYGAFYAGNNPLPMGSFLGLYEGKLVDSRERLDTLHASRAKELKRAGLEEEAKKVSDYVLSLDGGVHFLDGFDLRYRGIGENENKIKPFTPAHLNHSDKDDPSCNVLRKLVYLPEDTANNNSQDEPYYYPRNLPRVAFFAAREISVGEELAFDYGSNFWK